MGFDQNAPQPVIQPAKKTTKVNIWMVAALLLFFAVVGGAMAWMRYYHGH